MFNVLFATFIVLIGSLNIYLLSQSLILTFIAALFSALIFRRRFIQLNSDYSSYNEKVTKLETYSQSLDRYRKQR